MSKSAKASDTYIPLSYIEPEGSSVQVLASCEHPLSSIDPYCLDLPGPNWGFCKIDEESLIIFELVLAIEQSAPRIRKHIHLNLTNGICTSYIMDGKISVMRAVTKLDVESSIEELDFMHVCIGSANASKFPLFAQTNVQVDVFGKWRHKACKIVTNLSASSCKACESVEYELSKFSLGNKKKKSYDQPRSVMTVNLSHRKQSQIIYLQKGRQSWCKIKKNAENEIKMIDDMISEVLESGDNHHVADGCEDDEDDD